MQYMDKVLGTDIGKANRKDLIEDRTDCKKESQLDKKSYKRGLEWVQQEGGWLLV